MAIIGKLGIDGTALLQFCLFALAVYILTQFVFGPYFKQVLIREAKTKGAGDMASEIQKQAQDLQVDYQHKARDLNNQIKTIFDKEKEEALRACDEIIGKARQEAHQKVSMNRNQIEKNVELCMADVKVLGSQLALVIKNKLLGK